MADKRDARSASTASNEDSNVRLEMQIRVSENKKQAKHQWTIGTRYSTAHEMQKPDWQTSVGSMRTFRFAFTIL